MLLKAFERNGPMLYRSCAKASPVHRCHVCLAT